MADGFVPPQEVRANAKRGLELRAEHNRGGTEVGVARARDLSNGRAVSFDTIKRMVSYFARHEVDKQGEGWGKDSAGYIAWLLWGGDAGRSWATRINNEQNSKDKTSMAIELGFSYAEITKSEKHDDGTISVYGKATDDTLDVDLQICDPEWLSKAMPDWFVSGGNIREQHSSIAAGVATDYVEKSDGHYITAHVVDPNSVRKVEAGVLKGFSIGIRGPRVIRDTKAPGGRIVDGKIVEISLVDRPANPAAKLMLAKAAESGELMAVEQLDIPTPADVFKSVEETAPAVDAEVETPVVETVEVEALAETVEETPAVEETPEELTPEAELAEATKSFVATLNKFDQATFDRARVALSDLIIVEATEMAQFGSNEKDSIEELLDSIKHLFRWYEGEVEAGEVANPVVTDEVMDDSDEMLVMSADACDKCGDKMCKCGDKSATPEIVAIDDAQVSDIVEKAVKTAKDAVKTEVELLKSALEAEKAKSAELTADLDNALSKAVAGGPARTATTPKTFTPDALLNKASEYRSKASNTTDRILAQGYVELAEELERKAKKA